VCYGVGILTKVNEMKALILVILLTGCMTNNDVINRIKLCEDAGYGYTILRTAFGDVRSVNCDFEAGKIRSE